MFLDLFLDREMISEILGEGMQVIWDKRVVGQEKKLHCVEYIIDTDLAIRIQIQKRESKSKYFVFTTIEEIIKLGAIPFEIHNNFESKELNYFDGYQLFILVPFV